MEAHRESLVRVLEKILYPRLKKWWQLLLGSNTRSEALSERQWRLLNLITKLMKQQKVVKQYGLAKWKLLAISKKIDYAVGLKICDRLAKNYQQKTLVHETLKLWRLQNSQCITSSKKYKGIILISEVIANNYFSQVKHAFNKISTFAPKLSFALQKLKTQSTNLTKIVKKSTIKNEENSQYASQILTSESNIEKMLQEINRKQEDLRKQANSIEIKGITSKKLKAVGIIYRLLLYSSPVDYSVYKCYSKWRFPRIGRDTKLINEDINKCFEKFQRIQLLLLTRRLKAILQTHFRSFILRSYFFGPQVQIEKFLKVEQKKLKLFQLLTRKPKTASRYFQVWQNNVRNIISAEMQRIKGINMITHFIHRKRIILLTEFIQRINILRNYKENRPNTFILSKTEIGLSRKGKILGHTLQRIFRSRINRVFLQLNSKSITNSRLHIIESFTCKASYSYQSLLQNATKAVASRSLGILIQRINLNHIQSLTWAFRKLRENAGRVGFHRRLFQKIYLKELIRLKEKCMEFMKREFLNYWNRVASATSKTSENKPSQYSNFEANIIINQAQILALMEREKHRKNNELKHKTIYCTLLNALEVRKHSEKIHKYRAFLRWKQNSLLTLKNSSEEVQELIQKHQLLQEENNYLRGQSTKLKEENPEEEEKDPFGEAPEGDSMKLPVSEEDELGMEYLAFIETQNADLEQQLQSLNTQLYSESKLFGSELTSLKKELDKLL